MKAKNNIYEYKQIIDALSSVRNEFERNYIHKLIDSYSKWDSSGRRSLEALLDIIKNNESKDAVELFTKYKNSSNQYEKIFIRHGQFALDELKKKYKSRPAPTSVTCLTTSFWIGKGYSLKEANIKISEIQSKNSKKRHIKASRLSYKNIPHCVEFWINAGYSLEESIALKTEYNDKHSRSYKNMIRKYGEELGRKNVFIAVEKRKKTLLSRYGSTTFGGRASKASIYFFLPLYKQLRKLGITRADICWGIDGSREFATNYEGRNYFYDFTIKSLKYAIEYNGTYWHAREDLSWRRKDVTKDKSLEYDRNKCKAIEHRGFTLFTVWDDYDMIEQREKLFTEIQMLWKTIGQILK